LLGISAVDAKNGLLKNPWNAPSSGENCNSVFLRAVHKTLVRRRMGLALARPLKIGLSRSVVVGWRETTSHPAAYCLTGFIGGGAIGFLHSCCWRGLNSIPFEIHHLDRRIKWEIVILVWCPKFSVCVLDSAIVVCVCVGGQLPCGF
jgi:hypothetical protein